MDVKKAQKRNLGTNSPIRFDTGPSYAAVVSSTSFSSQIVSGLDIDQSKSENKSYEAKRTMVNVTDEPMETTNKKQCISSINNPISNETNHSKKDNGDIHAFLRQLDQALELEVKYRGAIQPSASALQLNSARTRTTMRGLKGEMITSEMRDGSSQVLRFLKVWYDLPSDVFFGAVSNVDRFLRKMKVCFELSKNKFRYYEF